MVQALNKLKMEAASTQNAALQKQLKDMAKTQKGIPRQADWTEQGYKQPSGERKGKERQIKIKKLLSYYCCN